MINKILNIFKDKFSLSKPYFYGISELEKVRLFGILKKHDIGCYVYFPHICIEDPELKDAIFKLSECGYLFTDKDGNIVGNVAKLNADSNDNAELRRKNFFVVK